MEDLVVLVIALSLAFFIGRHREQKHYQSIRVREAALVDFPLLTETSPVPKNFRAQLVTGSVVISVDRFKQFMGTLTSIFGGRVGAYESVLDRGRREAILRVKESARQRGGQGVVNLRIETSSIAGVQGSTGASEVIAYGTVLVPITNPLT
jgi:uncharacterized protein YbjQ (UPF0145 family)